MDLEDGWKIGLLGLAVAATVVAACGEPSSPSPVAPVSSVSPGGGAPPDATPGEDSPEAPFVPTFPRVVSRGGATVARPEVLPVFVKSDPHAAAIVTFAESLGRSAYWRESLVEYGVGELSVRPAVYLDGLASDVTDAELRALLVKSFESGALPPPAATTLYAIYPPAGTAIVRDGVRTCSGLAGYHDELTVGGIPIGYAVIARCEAPDKQLDELTVLSSHEYAEWATNPLPTTAPAFSLVNDEHWVWGRRSGPEISDLCFGLGGVPRALDGAAFLVQPQWSNMAARAGHDPCASGRSIRHAVGIPEQPDALDLPPSLAHGRVTTRAVRLARGASRTVRVLVHADGPLSAPLRLQVGPLPGSPSGAFSYALDRDEAWPGETVRLTVSAAQSAKAEVGSFAVVATAGGTPRAWPAMVFAP